MLENFGRCAGSKGGASTPSEHFSTQVPLSKVPNPPPNDEIGPCNSFKGVPHLPQMQLRKAPALQVWRGIYYGI